MSNASELASNQQDSNQKNQNTRPSNKPMKEFIKTVSRYSRLPKKIGESETYQFFPNEDKRRVVEKYDDKFEHDWIERGKFDVIDPACAEEGEKWLETPKTLASELLMNIEAGNCLLRIIKTQDNPTKYSVIAVNNTQ